MARLDITYASNTSISSSSALMMRVFTPVISKCTYACVHGFLQAHADDRVPVCEGFECQ